MAHFRVATGLCLYLVVLLHSNPVMAQVSGLCSNCHTMHNTQDGSVVDPEGPSRNLLNTDCVGCHSSSGSATILTLGGGTRIPIVYNHQVPTSPLAGGNFYWVTQTGEDGGDGYGHNVLGISDADATLDYAPGPVAGCDDCHGSLAKVTSVNKEDTGCRGCHAPRHHADDSSVIVDGTGGWYRFLGDNPWMLKAMGGAGSGVIGIEDADWEQTPATGHNVYKGTTTIYARAFGEYIRENSIGSFCAGCHADFHYKMNEGQGDFIEIAGDYDGAWIRHPSDVVIPASGEYNSNSTYNPMAPVAKSTTLVAGDANFQTVTPGSDVVTCISCHRAHGSPYPDMLRWDYQNDCKTGTANVNCGCFTCHTAKDD